MRLAKWSGPLALPTPERWAATREAAGDNTQSSGDGTNDKGKFAHPRNCVPESDRDDIRAQGVCAALPVAGVRNFAGRDGD